MAVDKVNYSPVRSRTAREEFKALPPEWQTNREIDAIRNDPRFLEQNIQEIKKTEHGYIVVTDKFTQRVYVEYNSRNEGNLGPASFILVFLDPEPR